MARNASAAATCALGERSDWAGFSVAKTSLARVQAWWVLARTGVRVERRMQERIFIMIGGAYVVARGLGRLIWRWGGTGGWPDLVMLKKNHDV